MKPQLLSAQDDYPFGSLMPGRSYNANGYRFGFNGQKKDDEVFNDPSTSYTAEFWQYDSRIGRRWNLDPKPNPAISQYATFALNPILYNDMLGDTVKYSNGAEEYVKKAMGNDKNFAKRISELHASDVVYEFNYLGEHKEGQAGVLRSDGDKIFFDFTISDGNNYSEFRNLYHES